MHHYKIRPPSHNLMVCLSSLMLATSGISAMHLNSDRSQEYTPEPYHHMANRPYCIKHKCFNPDTSIQSFAAKGTASWYGRPFHGRKTSTGEQYNMFSYTAASTFLPIPSYAKVTNLNNKKTIIVRINDRGPFIDNRILDLSYGAAHKLGFTDAGLAKVHVEWINPHIMAKLLHKKNTSQSKTSLKKLNPHSTLHNLKHTISTSNIANKRNKTLISRPQQLYHNKSQPPSTKQYSQSPLRLIQIAYFKQQKLAENFNHHFQIKHPNIPSTIKPLKTGYQILIGPFTEPETAATLFKLQKDYKGAFLVTAKS